MTAQVAADLRAAADVLRRDGWTQGAYWSEDGRRACLETATFRAAEYDITRIQNALSAVARHISPVPIAWNDEPGRTADEVIAALLAAADAAEAEQ